MVFFDVGIFLTIMVCPCLPVEKQLRRMDFFEIVNRFVEDLQTTFLLDHLGGIYLLPDLVEFLRKNLSYAGHVSFMLLICHQLQWLGSLQSGRHVDPRWSADHNWTYLSPQGRRANETTCFFVNHVFFIKNTWFKRNTYIDKCFL